jgi:hypothetical protein
LFGPEHLEIDCTGESLALFAEIAGPPKAYVKVEKS